MIFSAGHYRFLSTVFPELLTHLPGTQKRVHLTFDDGPVAGITDQVLDVLATEGITATFFCLGKQIERNPALFRRILDEGHTVGNHSWEHPNGWRVDQQTYLADIERCQQLYPFRYFRPPYGRLPWGLRQQIAAAHRIVMWDVLTYDFDTSLDSEQCLERSLSRVQPGSVIVMHDSLKAWPRLEKLLPALIAELRKQGFTFAALEDGTD